MARKPTKPNTSKPYLGKGKTVGTPKGALTANKPNPPNSQNPSTSAKIPANQTPPANPPANMDPLKRFKLKLHLLEDLHSGTGTGQAEVDAVQARDRRQHPILRATHIKGVWKEAARRLAKLDATKYGGLAEKLFGGHRDAAPAPGSGAVDHRPGTTESGAVLMTSAYLPGSSQDIVWQSSSRQPLNRAPLDDTLHSVEHVGAGAVFELEVRLPAALEKHWQACLAHTPALGARRSRNSRNVHWELDPNSTQAPKQVNPTNPQGNQLQLRLLLRNLDPLGLPLTGNPSNIINSEGYIRGQRLFGAFGRWAVDRGGLDVNKVLFDRCVQIGNAYPLPPEIMGDPKLKDQDLRSWDVMPIPQQIGTKKPAPQGDGHWPWWAEAGGGETYLGDLREANRFQDRNSDLKRPKGYEFLFRQNATERWRRYAPVLGVHMRNQIKDKKLFSEQEIAEKTCFLADIRFPDLPSAEAFAAGFARLLWGREWLTLGRGGRPVEVLAAVWMDTPQAIPPNTAVALSLPSPNGRGVGGEGEEEFTFTLESDLIARARKSGKDRLPTLGFYDRLDPSVLLELIDGFQDCDPSKWQWDGFCETRTLYGFNAASGLPRAPVQVIERGSAIRVWGAGAQALRAKLAAKLTTGLGEATWAGFGRFRLDFDPLQSNGSLSTNGLPSTPELLQSESLLAEAEQWAGRITAGPSQSQWQEFRHRVLAVHSWQQIQALFTEYQARAGRSAGEAWNDLGNSGNPRNLATLQQKVNAIFPPPAPGTEAEERQRVERQRVDDCVFFLDVLVRYRLLAMNNR